MKKTLIAVAAVGTLASPNAFAQTLYGIIDVGYQHLNYANGDTNKDFLVQGQHTGSRLGVRGSKDLDGGIYGLYRIEFNIQADNGDPALTGTQRLTVVGVGSKEWGELTLGQQYTHTFHTFGLGQASDYGTFASPYTWTGFVPPRASNSMKYSSPEKYPFTVGAIYGLSGLGTTESTTAGTDADYWDGAVRYTPGPFGVSASYGASTAKAAGVESETTRTQLSGKWDNRTFGIYGNWWNQETETGPATTEDRTGWSISGVTRFGGRHELYAVWGSQQDDIIGGTSKSTVWGITYQYVVSKDFRVYVGYQNVDNAAASARTVNVAAAPTTAGFDPYGFQFGFVYYFSKDIP